MNIEVSKRCVGS